MNKFVTIAIVATTVSFAVVGNASAFQIIINPAIINALLAKKGVTANPGEPFNPRTSEIDPFDACEDAGGIIKRQIQDDGTIGYRCIL